MAIENIHTVAEVCQAAGEALANRDSNTLADLSLLVSNWLMPQTEVSAIVSMLDAMVEAAAELEMYESNDLADSDEN